MRVRDIFVKKLCEMQIKVEELESLANSETKS